MPKYQARVDVSLFKDKQAMDLALYVQSVIRTVGGRCNAKQYSKEVYAAETLLEVANISNAWINIINIGILKDG